MSDDLRPRGTVEVECSACGWLFWLDPLDPRLPDGPHVCPPCDGDETEPEKAGPPDTDREPHLWWVEEA